MLFMLQCFDKPNSLEIRMATRPAHLEHLASLGDKLVLAGPMMQSENEMKPMGSLVLIDAEDAATAEAFAANDPYEAAGLFERVVVRPYVAAVGSWKPTD